MGRGKRQSGSSKKKKGKKKGNKAQQQQEEEDVVVVNMSEQQTSLQRPAATRPTTTTTTLPSASRRDPNHTRSMLESLPPHLLFKIVNHLDQREKDILFHVVTGNAVEGLDSGGEAVDSETINNNNNNNNSDSHHHSTTNNNNNTSPPPPHRWRVPLEFVTADPDTLLARLNTRRLYKRLQDTNTDYTFPSNMTTDEIALHEWNNILERATKEGRVPLEQLPPLISPSRELLMFTPCPRSVAVLASYPRSGNSLLRSLYEKITLRVSGSDMRGGLVSHDLVGEAAVSSNRVQFVKTHYPERRGIKQYHASRVVLLVRNPHDALESYFNLMTTGTHTTSLDEHLRGKLETVWESMVRKEISVWQAFYEFWLAQEIPLLLVRYEDLIRYPYQVMCRVIKFVLEVCMML